MYLKRFSKGLKNQDIFGHVIHFNFKSQGETYNTCIGGLFSIIIYVGMTLYVGWNVKKLIFLEDDTISTVTSSLELKDLGAVNKTNLRLTMFHSLYKMSEGQRALKINDDLDRYLKFQYVQVESNYWRPPSEYFKKKHYNVR